MPDPGRVRKTGIQQILSFRGEFCHSLHLVAFHHIRLLPFVTPVPSNLIHTDKCRCHYEYTLLLLFFQHVVCKIRSDCYNPRMLRVFCSSWCWKGSVPYWQICEAELLKYSLYSLLTSRFSSQIQWMCIVCLGKTRCLYIRGSVSIKLHSYLFELGALYHQ